MIHNPSKKLGLPLLILLLAVGSAFSQSKSLIYVSVPPVQPLLNALVQDFAEVQSVLLPGETPHNWQPSAQRMKSLVKADLVFLAGLGYEKKMLKRLPEIKVENQVFLWQGQDFIGGHNHDDDHEGEHDEHDGHDEHHEHSAQKEIENIDPHLWTSPWRMLVALPHIQKSLINKFPTHKAAIKLRVLEQEKILKDLHQEMIHTFEKAQGSALFFYHPAFNYLLNDYGLKSIELETEGKMPGTQSLLKLLKSVESQKIKILWVQPQYSLRKLSPILNDFGISTRIADPMDQKLFEKLKGLAQEWAKEITQRAP